MSEYKKFFDLEKRTLEYSKRIVLLSKSLSKTIENDVFRKQFVRSGTSIGANYCKANEKFSEKDFIHRMKICRKELKETHYWLLLVAQNNFGNEYINEVLAETIELKNIFCKIINIKEGSLRSSSQEMLVDD